MLQATNKIAGRRVMQTLETSKSTVEAAEATTSFDDNVETVTMIKNTSFEEEELKIKVDKIILRANNGGQMSCQLWLQQFLNLVSIQQLGGPSPINWILHIITFPWKLLAAFIPPAALFGGYPAFVLSSVAILRLTFLIVDISGHLGCFILCKDAVTGFILISTGLNIPNVIAARLAAVEEDTADLPLLCLLAGNAFTSSLGFGLVWFIGSVYWESNGHEFIVPVGSLGFCIVMFVLIGIIPIIVLLVRRCCAGGELGGNQFCKIITTIIFFLLWIFFLFLVPLEANGVIQPGF
eukprot:GFUD01015558.1.p1 GENE.GFUD01015558.1~~GFUD01015558.1.p1  ORF type:complete len:294 (+),score=66.98 GFUD01015558.1:788-1669(+)